MGGDVNGSPASLKQSSPMITALTVSKMKAFLRRKRRTCSRVMVCRRRRVRSALCCRLSWKLCRQPTPPRRWPLSLRNRLLPWLLIVSLPGQKRPCLVREESEKGVGKVERRALQLRSQGRGDFHLPVCYLAGTLENPPGSDSVFILAAKG